MASRLLSSGPMRALVLFAALVVVGCGRPAPDLDATEGASFEVKGAGGGLLSRSGGSSEGVGTFGSTSLDSASPAAEAGSASSSTTGTGAVPAGILTAGLWDDTLNFPLFAAFRDGLSATERLPDFDPVEQDAAAAAPLSAKTSLDIALVIDTTGSMGDEIDYLQAEFQAIAATVAAQYPGVPQRWALIDYKDTQDDYVLRGADFGTSVAWFQSKLDQMGASGGGDFPEAPDQALAHATQLSWNPSPSAAKLIFWVADAPPHLADGAAFSAAVRGLRDLDVHVYPVASSGIDRQTEYTMRATAQLTQGRYLFLTDDSGVGGEHLEPSIPCYAVTRLNHAMERVVQSELAGARVEVDPALVLRTSGAPSGGQCLLPSGVTATLF